MDVAGKWSDVVDDGVRWCMPWAVRGGWMRMRMRMYGSGPLLGQAQAIYVYTAPYLN
jgi:hypothetical protein